MGRDNTVLGVNFTPQSKGTVRCREELSGIIKHYYRDAAQSPARTSLEVAMRITR